MNKSENYKKTKIIKNLAIISTLIATLLPISYWSCQTYLKNKILENTFKTSPDLKLPESFEKNQKIINGSNDLKLQIFSFKGNSNSKKTLVVVPGMTGVYYWLDEFIKDQEVLNNYNSIYLFNQIGQGKSIGTLNTESLVNTIETVYRYAQNANKGSLSKMELLCVSAGAVACTNGHLAKIVTQDTRITLLNPVVGSKELLQNINSDKIKKDDDTRWIEQNEKSTINLVLENKKILNFLYPNEKEFDIFTNFAGPKSFRPYEVYYTPKDEFFTPEQYKNVFTNKPNVKLVETKANSHSDLQVSDIKKILF